MTAYEQIQSMRDKIREVAARHGVTRIRVFGSVARQEESPGSDVDFLVVVGSEPTPWFPAGLILELLGDLIIPQGGGDGRRAGGSRGGRGFFSFFGGEGGGLSSRTDCPGGASAHSLPK